MKKNHTIHYAPVIALIVLVFLLAGCTAKEPATLSMRVEGKELSDARVTVGKKDAGFFEQTCIKADGDLYVGGVFRAKLPSNPVKPGEETCTGGIGPLSFKPGKYTIAMQSPGSTSVEISIRLDSGYHLITYFPEKKTIRWHDKTIPVPSDGKVSFLK